MAQWGPIAEDDCLAGRKCEKGASPSTDRVESPSRSAATTCAFVTMRPIANVRLLLSQRISGCNRAPLWHFLTPGRRNSAIGMHGNQHQSSQRTSDAQMPLRRGNVCQASKNKRAEAATRRSVGIANASPGDSLEHTAAQPCMSRRAIKCAYGGEIEFIPPRMRHSALYAPSRTNEDYAMHDAFTPVAATGQERTTAAPGPSAYRRECDTPQFAPPSTPRFKIERTFRLLSISLLI